MKKPLSTDDWVKDAAGAIGRVQGFTHDGGVRVWFITGGERTLLVQDVKRIADPTKQRPPIDGMPDEHRCCAHCNKKLRVITNNTYELLPGQQLYRRIAKRTFSRWSAYGDQKGGFTEALFCSLTCALHFAQACYRGGIRVTLQKPLKPMKVTR